MLGFCAFFVLCFVLIVFFIHGLMNKANGGETAFFDGSSNEIDLIEIDGPITNSDDVVKRIRRFKKALKKPSLSGSTARAGR